MRLDKFSSSDLIGARPTLQMDKPSLKDGQWLVSGKMIVEFVAERKSPPGHPPEPGLKLSLGFVDARDEADAVHQASLHLEKIGAEIAQVAAALLSDGP